MLIVGALGSGTAEMSAALTKLGVEVREGDRQGGTQAEIGLQKGYGVVYAVWSRMRLCGLGIRKVEGRR